MISYEQKEKKFNFRVGGILESPDRKKVLIHRLSNFNFWLLPGERVQKKEYRTLHKIKAIRPIKSKLLKYILYIM